MLKQLEELMSNPQAAQAYQAWLAREDTVHFLGLVLAALAPGGLPADKNHGEGALYYAGLVDMHTATRDAFSKVSVMTDTAGQTKAIQEFLSAPSYSGAQDKNEE